MSVSSPRGTPASIVMQPRFTPPQHTHPDDIRVEGLGTWVYALVLIAGTGFFLLVLSISLLVEPKTPPVLWVCWVVSLVLVLLAIAEARLFRVTITRTTITVRHLWVQAIPLSELRSIHARISDIVVMPRRGAWLLIPSAVTNRDALLDHIARAIAANLAADVPGVSADAARRVRDRFNVP